MKSKLKIFVYLGKELIMSAIVIQADKKSNKLLSDLAKKLGGNVLFLNDEQYEDFALGALMDKVKTNETVSRDLIMKKLKAK
jgi:hypothetical protein